MIYVCFGFFLLKEENQNEQEKNEKREKQTNTFNFFFFYYLHTTKIQVTHNFSSPFSMRDMENSCNSENEQQRKEMFCL